MEIIRKSKLQAVPDPSWKRVEDCWVSDHGNPYMLMREEQVEIKANGERHVWNSRGDYQIEWSMGPVYMTPDGKCGCVIEAGR